MVNGCAATDVFEPIHPAAPAEEAVARAPRPLYLVVIDGGVPGAMHAIAAPGVAIGRSAENALAMPEASVSRRHARLDVDDAGRARLMDLASTNGTFVNGRKLNPGASIGLAEGDRIQFGSKIVVKFVRPDPIEERFQREMFERTVRDSLTGLYNRGYFLEEVGRLGEREALRGLGLAILMIDVDRFKRINDALSHDAGDQVLCEVSSVLRRAMRGDDLIARYGGEEFIAALPVSAVDQALDRAERVRAALADRRIGFEGRPIEATVSIGVAFNPADRRRSIAGLIAAADQGLYQAKNAGRDRVALGPDPRAGGEEQNPDWTREDDSTSAR